MDSPQEQSDRPWLHRFSTAELAVLVFIFSVMGAVVWYKKFYEPRIAVVPSSSSASQKTSPTPVPTPDLAAQISDSASNPAEKLPETNPFQANTNPFADAYENPFAQ